MVECGVDIIEIGRIEQAIARLGQRFLQRIYTQQERDYCQGRTHKLAARWAAKEAVGKVLGTGLWREGVSWHQIEVVNAVGGKPYLQLSGEAARRAEEMGLRHWSISLSHDRAQAIAFVVASS